MMAREVQNIETYRKADELMRVFRSAVRKAQAENRRLGIPNYFSHNGQRYMEMPNGEIVRIEDKNGQ
jgi:hypothetical protein